MSCIICIDHIDNKFTTQCGHSYCQDCIIKWVIEQNICPLCRTKNIITFCKCGELINSKYSGCFKCTDLKFEEENMCKLQNDLRRRYKKLSLFKKLKLKVRQIKYKKIIKKSLKILVNGGLNTFFFFTGILKTKYKVSYHLFLTIFYFSLSAFVPHILVSTMIIIGIISLIRLVFYLCFSNSDTENVREESLFIF